MSHSITPNCKPSDEDVAYEILAAHGRPMYYYDLIREVLNTQGRNPDPAHISGILTQINLDTRFSYLGNGDWGLKSWVPTKGSKKLPTITLMNKALVYDDSSDLELDKELLFEDSEDLDEEMEVDPDEESYDKEEGGDLRKGDQEDDSW